MNYDAQLKLLTQLMSRNKQVKGLLIQFQKEFRKPERFQDRFRVGFVFISDAVIRNLNLE